MSLSLLIPQSTGLTVDVDRELVYVIDGNTHKLVVIGFDGKGYRDILTDQNKIRHPFSMALMRVSSGSLFFTLRACWLTNGTPFHWANLFLD